MAKIILNVELAKSNVVKNLKELEAGIQGIGKSLGDVKVNKNLTAQLNALTRQYNALAKAAKEAQKVDNKQAIEKQKLAKATAQVSTAKINEQKATVQLQTAQVRLTKAQESGTKVVKKATEENEKHRQSILSMAQGFFQWQMAATLVMKPLQMVRNAWASINETLVKTEDAVISLQRVLNDDSLSDSTISGKLYDLAQRYGQTFDNVNDIAQNFARTGMSWVETIQATESALLALNVAELDATQASDGMIAIMQQFGYEASELTGIIDILNKTADKFPVTTDKLLTALQRTGSSAKNAKLDLAETVGIITALSKATGRSGENIGTAVNSLIQYSSKDTALDTFASLDKNTADVVAKYRKGGATILDVWMAVSGVINNMDSRQESILAGVGNSADITDLNQELQDELGDIFETVSDVYGTANTFRKNYFIALLGDMQTVKDAIETASDANGYSQKENEKYLDTYTAKVNTLNAKWEELANNEQGLLGVKKDLVELGIGALDLIENLDGIQGVLKTTIAVASPFLANWTLTFGAEALKQTGKGLVSLFSALKGGAYSVNAALGGVGILLGVGSTILNVTRANREQAQEEQSNSIEKGIQNVDKYNDALEKNSNTTKDLIKQIELYRDAIDSENSTTEEKENAQSKLLDIQNSLIESNNVYANSLDLINGKLEDQIGLIDTVGIKEQRNKIKEYLDDNASNIKDAKDYLNKEFSTFSFAGENKDFWDAAYSATDFEKWLHKLGYSEQVGYVQTGDDFFSKNLSAIKGFFGADDAYKLQFDLESDSNREDILLFLEMLLEKASNDASLSEDQKEEFRAIIDRTRDAYNTDTYQNATNLIFGNKGQKESFLEWLSYEQKQTIASGEMSDAEFIKLWNEFYEITEQQVDTTQTWAETLEGTLTNYKDLLDYITEIRDREKEINDLEEKQLAVEKAKQALEDARKNKTVYHYNAQTGSWERVADEKAIADAEEKFENAEEAYEEALLKSMEDEKLTVGQILEKVEGLPDLTSTILEWLKKQGYDVPDNLMFGPSSTVPSVTSGMATNTNSTTNNNTSYVINGVPIPQEIANKYNLPDIIEEVANLPN